MLKNTDGNKLFLALLTLTVLAVVLNFISFVSPFWIQSIPSKHSQFMRIGLWTACFNGYMRPNEYDKAYYGCFYIYYVEYDRIRSWINPVWFYCVQVLSTLGMLLHSSVLFIILCQATRSIARDNRRWLKFHLVGHFFTALTLAASLVAFAVARYDSRWMPYPHLNVLSWAYALGVVSFLLTITSFAVAFVYLMLLEAIADAEVQELMAEPDPGKYHPPPALPRTALSNEGYKSLVNEYDDENDEQDFEPSDKRSYFDSRYQSRNGHGTNSYVNT